MKSIKDLWKPEALADKLGIGERELLSWRKDGMPYIQVGKFIYIPEGRFLKWMESYLINGEKDEKTEGDRPKQAALSLVSKV
jgi:hypothetical protein